MSDPVTLKPGRYVIDITDPWFFGTLKERVAATYKWLEAKKAKVESHSPMPPSAVRVIFALEKKATWTLDFGPPRRTKKTYSKISLADAKKRGLPDVVDNTVDVIKEQWPQGIVAALILWALMSRGGK